MLDVPCQLTGYVSSTVEDPSTFSVRPSLLGPLGDLHGHVLRPHHPLLPAQHQFQATQDVLHTVIGLQELLQPSGHPSPLLARGLLTVPVAAHFDVLLHQALETGRALARTVRFIFFFEPFLN